MSHIFYLDHPKTSVVAVNSIHFSSSFIFIFDIFMPQKTLICTFYFFKAGDKNWVTLQSSVTWVSLARTRETLSWRLVEKPYVCARHVLFTNYLEFRSEDWQFIQMGCIIGLLALEIKHQHFKDVPLSFCFYVACFVIIIIVVL